MIHIAPDNYRLQERILATLRELPDEEVSSNLIRKEVVKRYEDVEEPTSEVDETLQELIILGEVELTAERGTGGRVRLKRREPTSETSRGKPEREPVSAVWSSYFARDYRDRMADRLFTSREDAMEHLSYFGSLSSEDFDRVPHLDEVWWAPIEGGWEHEEMVAVVRWEPIYTLVQRRR